MKITKKDREQTAMESRETSIVIFVLIALIPLLFAFFLGMGLGKSDTLNKENLQRELIAEKQVHQNLNDKVTQLGEEYTNLNTEFRELQKEKIFKLKKQFPEIQDLTSLRAWKINIGDIRAFNEGLDDITTTDAYDDYPNLNSILVLGVNWMDEYLKDTENYLVMEGDSKEIELNLQNSENNQAIIDALKDQLNQQQIDKAQDDISSLEDEKVQLSLELNTYKQEVNSSHEGMVDVIDMIIDELLPELEGQKFLKLKNDTKKVDDLKRTIERKLTDIKTELNK